MKNTLMNIGWRGMALVSLMAGLVSSEGFAASSLITEAERVYELWENEPAPNLVQDSEPTKNGDRLIYHPYDEAWEYWSYPIGNGYMGANVFGGTDVERIQLTEKTLFNTGLYGLGGLTSFAEIDIHFNHEDVEGYKRSLNLNDAMAHVGYTADGVGYSRELFVSYPDEVLVINLKADKAGALNFTLAPRIPYLKSLREEDKKTGTVVAKGNAIILSGTLPNEGNNFEAQFRVLNKGGTLTAEGGRIKVEGANSVSILVVAGTNYEPGSKVFLNNDRIKLDPAKFPHDRLSATMSAAVAKGPAQLKARHLDDYKNLFDRVAVNLNSTVSELPTHELLEGYQGDAKDTWLEELMFQYGRYLLIASSRENTLPSGLQGTWSQYEITPWTGGYWHNINVQMNYWGAFAVNLKETFEAYINYFKAYHPKAEENAYAFLERHHPNRVSNKPGENGWAIGTGATPYKINMPGGHSGPGTGGFTTKMLMDYYEYTLNQDYLEEVAYPALLGMSRLFSKTLVEQDGFLLVSPSASPENPITAEQLKGQPGHLAEDGRHYVTKGCTFDQGFVWENHTDVLKLAEVLGKKEPFLDTIRAELPKLDPIIIGDSGQIKEWREETVYSSIGQKGHRHISHLCTLYPGTLVNSSTPEWTAAAEKTLNFRGDVTTGWAMAHRINCWARLADGDRAHKIYQLFIAEKTVPNLWTLHPPFQIDGNFGAMAGVAEMLLQSHEDCISVLPALPKAWGTGSFNGLVARGNFVLSAKWDNMQLSQLKVTSRSGGTCRLKLQGTDNAKVEDASGRPVECSITNDGLLVFETDKGQAYKITLLPVALFGQVKTPTHAHVSYGPEERQWLNLYLPSNSEPAPVFIYAHHNAATADDVKPTWADPAIAAGIAIVSWESIAKVKSPKDGLTCVADAEVMFDWVKDNAGTYNLDVNNIFIGGQSRGSGVSWLLAHSQKAGIAGIYMGQALPGESFNERALEPITENSPPIFLAYRKEPGCEGDIHDPAHGLRVLERYKELGIGDKAELVHSLNETNDNQVMQFLHEFVRSVVKSKQ